MISPSRRRLTLQFVVITSVIYTVLLWAGIFIFSSELTNSLDNQLDVLLSELGEIVEYDQGNLTLDRPKKVIKTQPLGGLARIQLYNKYGKLIEQHGIASPEHLSLDTEEYDNGDYAIRSKSILLETDDSQKVGYLQAQLPTTLRDRAVGNYAFTMGILTFLGVILLSIAGYVFSKLASRPLEQSYDLLRQFTADAAHEFGTPVATISAATDNLREELTSMPHLEKRLDVIERATGRMNKLSEDLMLLTRLGVEADERSKGPEKVNLSEVVKDVVEDFELRCKQKDIGLRFRKEDEHAFVVGYKDTLERLVANLLENALRYTNNGGTVSVSVGLENRVAKLIVSDTGIGIPAESIHNLFDRFYRVDKDRSREAGGSGLGLSIVKAIVELHNGEISVKSKPGEGSTFAVVLRNAGG